MHPNTDRGQGLAYAGGEFRVPEACIGCHSSLCRTAECELCDDNPDPDSAYEVERQATRIMRAMEAMIRAERGRYELRASIDSPTFQSQIKQPMSILLDAHDRLMDATNSSTAKPEGE
jgi:hypothetical protein